MKNLKKTIILLITLTLMSSSVLAFGGKKRPPQVMSVEYVQLYLVGLFK